MSPPPLCSLVLVNASDLRILAARDALVMLDDAAAYSAVVFFFLLLIFSFFLYDFDVFPFFFFDVFCLMFR